MNNALALFDVYDTYVTSDIYVYAYSDDGQIAFYISFPFTTMKCS